MNDSDLRIFRFVKENDVMKTLGYIGNMPDILNILNKEDSYSKFLSKYDYSASFFLGTHHFYRNISLESNDDARADVCDGHIRIEKGASTSEIQYNNFISCWSWSDEPEKEIINNKNLWEKYGGRILIESKVSLVSSFLKNKLGLNDENNKKGRIIMGRVIYGDNFTKDNVKGNELFCKAKKFEDEREYRFIVQYSLLAMVFSALIIRVDEPIRNSAENRDGYIVKIYEPPE